MMCYLKQFDTNFSSNFPLYYQQLLHLFHSASPNIYRINSVYYTVIEVVIIDSV